jgi:glutathionyl-hydroquinone reductase
MSVVRAYPKGDENGWPGWKFPADDVEYPNATVDHLFGSKYLHEVYFKADPEYKGRYSVPVIWDKKTGTIVNNESAEIMRWLQGAFQGVVDTKRPSMDLYPEHLRDAIDEVSEWMQSNLNRGVYQAGFAETQEEYERMVPPVFAALNRVEKMIAKNGGPYLLGNALTELDVRAYVTIVRFDAVYGKSLLNSPNAADSLHSAALQAATGHNPPQLPTDKQLAKEAVLPCTRFQGNH